MLVKLAGSMLLVVEDSPFSLTMTLFTVKGVCNGECTASGGGGVIFTYVIGVNGLDTNCIFESCSARGQGSVNIDASCMLMVKENVFVSAL